MKYLRRKEDEYLLQWKQQPDHMPLIIKGARQVGKTETVRMFARANYKSFIEVNFITEPEYRSIVNDGYKTDDIVRLMSRLDPGKEFRPKETLIFFDEIQDFPDIATSLKFFYEDGRYDIICSGSLLGVHYRHISSISVGSKTDYQMHGMDFEEFLWAKGYENGIADQMLTQMVSLSPFSELEHRKFLNLYLEYCITGGMPKVVSGYIEKNSFEGTLALQRQLVTDYEGDARKYAEGLDQAKIINVYRSVPAQLAKENKKFQYAKVKKGGRAKDYAGCIEWLSDAGIVSVCYCMGFPELPLKGNVDSDKFKLYIADTGLLVASLDDEVQADIRTGRNMGVYKGALYENFAAEALTKQGYDLYYYKKEDSTLEEDFFIRSASELIPIEVKANGNRAKSMRQLITSEHYPDISHGIKFSAGNVGYENGICTFPFFCLYLLKRYMEKQTVFC